MKFNNPEILFLLLLLLIPLFIHLFQLQRFQKIAFTNVKLLRQIEQQTRKSSRLKKLLILLSRLLLLSSLIIAFSEPFYSYDSDTAPKETTIYLDNSFSMQAKGERGELLENVKHDLIDASRSIDYNFALITNKDLHSEVESSNLKNKLLDISYYPKKKSISTVLLQSTNIENKKINNKKNIILISDFQIINGNLNDLKPDSTHNYYIVQTIPKRANNISLDSIWVADRNIRNILLRAKISSHEMSIENLSVSIFLNKELYGKTSVTLKENTNVEVEFSIPNLETLSGELTINDNMLPFDNTLYFAINKKEKTKVLCIGDDDMYLRKIYTDNEFIYTTSKLDQLDHNNLNKQHLIIVNGIETFPKTLINTLNNFVENGGSIVIIPRREFDLSSYNEFFSVFNMGKINGFLDAKKSITTVNYRHPFYKNVFQTEIDNFQYPVVKWSVSTTLLNASSLLKFNDRTDFISLLKKGNGKIFWFASSLHQDNSNFISSPLVVPTFYNFSIQNESNEKLYYTVSRNNEVHLEEENIGEQVYHITNHLLDYIPIQNRTVNSVKIKTDLEPSLAGNYQIKYNSEIRKEIAFNYSREENKLIYRTLESMANDSDSIYYFESINEALTSINDQYKKHNLWQLFVIFALLFLVIEILLQKFIKT